MHLPTRFLVHCVRVDDDDGVLKLMLANGSAGNSCLSGDLPVPYESGGADVGNVSQLRRQHRYLPQGTAVVPTCRISSRRFHVFESK